MSSIPKLALLAILAVTAVSVIMLSNSSTDASDHSLRHDSKLKAKFEEFKKKFSIKFHSLEDEIYRLAVFAKNLEHIERENSKNLSFKLGINQFAHYTTQEFIKLFLSSSKEENGVEPDGTPILSTQDLPESVNWVEKGAVTGVKNQGKCGGCYAFSATGALEGAYYLNTSELLSFSEQQILDCSFPEGNEGCDGGYPNNSFLFAQRNGIATEDEYPAPYSAYTDGVCLLEKSTHEVSKFYNVVQGDCDQLQAAVAQQPISVGVDASTFHFYSSGVLDDCEANLNHGVLAVGYTSEYWIIKNSWGPSFGEKGYIRLARGNTCGVCNAPSYPVY